MKFTKLKCIGDGGEKPTFVIECTDEDGFSEHFDMALEDDVNEFLDLLNVLFNENRGVNKVDLPEGWTLKATYKLNRTLDETTLPLIKNYLQSCGFNVDGLIEYKPTLVIMNLMMVQ